MRENPADSDASLLATALALIDVELCHHREEARCHMAVGMKLPSMRATAFHAGRVHGRRMLAWRMVRDIVREARRSVRSGDGG